MHLLLASWRTWTTARPTTLTAQCALYGTSRSYATNPPSSFKSPLPRIHLGNLSPAPGSQHQIKRLGRGQGSGRGGTSTKGHKGQKAHGTGPRRGFEGGQTPITRRFPKRGFHNFLTKEYAPLNLERLQAWIDQGRIEVTEDRAVTATELLKSQCIHQIHDGVKILGDGANYFHTAINLIVSRASKSAIKAIESAGGKVVCRHYNPLAVRDLKKGDMKHKLAPPMREKDILFYSNWKTNRGYLAIPPEIRAMPAFSGSHLDAPEHLRPAMPESTTAPPGGVDPAAALAAAQANPPPAEVVLESQPGVYS